MKVKKNKLLLQKIILIFFYKYYIEYGTIKK